MAESALDAGDCRKNEAEVAVSSDLSGTGELSLKGSSSLDAQRQIVAPSITALSDGSANADKSNQPVFTEISIAPPITPPPLSVRRPQRRLQPIAQRRTKPRDLLDVEWIQSQAPSAGCMSDQDLDAVGVMRLLRFYPTMLAPGSVLRVLRRYRQKEQAVPFMTDFEAEIKEWQQSSQKWLRAAQRQGVDFPVDVAKLQEWIARAEAVLAGLDDESSNQEETETGLLPEELLLSAKDVLKKKQEAERCKREQRLVGAIDRLHKSPSASNNTGMYRPINGGSDRYRRSSVTHAEASLYQEMWRFGDRPTDSGTLCTASDFTKSLLSKYETLSHAWDNLDKNGNGVVDFNEFVIGCRKIQINGKLRQIFDQLSSNGQMLQLTDLDPGLAEEQSRRREMYNMKKEHRGNVRASMMVLPPLQRLNMPSPKALTGDFDADAIEDFAKNRMPNRMSQITPNTLGINRMSQIMPKVGRASWVQTMSEVQNFIHSGENRAAPLPDCAQDFHQVLLKRYRTLSAAWDDLDGNKDGVLQFHEFVAGCRKLHFRGNLRQMFSDLCSGTLHTVQEEEDESDSNQEVLRMTDLDPSMKEEAEKRVNLGRERKRLKQQDLQEHNNSKEPHRFSRSSLARASLMLADSRSFAAGQSLPAIEENCYTEGVSLENILRAAPAPADKTPFVC